MNLDAVRTFVAVADTGRFAAAADDLSVTQQAVSKRVAALERELGVRLFVRTARGVQLTSDGQAFPAARTGAAGGRAPRWWRCRTWKRPSWPSSPAPSTRPSGP